MLNGCFVQAIELNDDLRFLFVRAAFPVFFYKSQHRWWERIFHIAEVYGSDDCSPPRGTCLNKERYLELLDSSELCKYA